MNEAVTQEGVATSSALDAVRRLNGRDRSLVGLDDIDDNSLAVGGGLKGFYTVTFAVNIDEAFFRATDERQPDNLELDMIVGGQGTTVPLKYCVDLAAALEAVRAFVESGKMSSSLHWEKQR